MGFAMGIGAMMRVLFDTSVVSYWLLDRAEFRPSIRNLRQDLDDSRANSYISAVSIQELAVAGQMSGSWDRWYKWIEEQFVVLPFTERCADLAASVQVAVGRPSKRTKPEQRYAKSLWFRDAAIVGTGIVGGFDMVVSTDRGFRDYQKLFAGEIRILAPVAVLP